jgi:hypothetical protein
MKYNVNRKPFGVKLTYKAIANFPALDSRLRGNDVVDSFLSCYITTHNIALLHKKISSTHY